MYDAHDTPCFGHVELEILRYLPITGLTTNEKTDKRIIGDMAHTYFITLSPECTPEVVEDGVEAMRKKYPDLHFRVRDSKNNVGEVEGVYLRVGATPPTDKSLAAEAIDKMGLGGQSGTTG